MLLFSLAYNKVQCFEYLISQMPVGYNIKKYLEYSVSDEIIEIIKNQ